jgi:hypothetical protein
MPNLGPVQSPSQYIGSHPFQATYRHTPKPNLLVTNLLLHTMNSRPKIDRPGWSVSMKPNLLVPVFGLVRSKTTDIQHLSRPQHDVSRVVSLEQLQSHIARKIIKTRTVPRIKPPELQPQFF